MTGAIPRMCARGSSRQVRTSGVVSKSALRRNGLSEQLDTSRGPRYFGRFHAGAGDATGATGMKLKLLAPLLVIAFLALPLTGCNKEPAPKEGTMPKAAAPKASTVMNFDEGALFEFDKADLKPAGKEQLNAYREKAKADLSSAEKVRVVGYTDNTGTAEHNSK
ncbi:MAG: hypothetical protein EOP82_29285, partial [Variovorax sp.]